MLRLKDKIRRIKNRIKSIIGWPSYHWIIDFDIKLPADHELPSYQLRHPKYDRFLPHLAQYLDPHDVVVDVGANVGDTLAGMLQSNPQLKFVCVEADKRFYKYLLKNERELKANFVNIQVDSINAFVGADIRPLGLTGKRGTKRALVENSKEQKPEIKLNRKDKNSISIISLDRLISYFVRNRLRLIKSDVDGFDFDILNSAKFAIGNWKPLLYFEMDYGDEWQLDGYLRSVDSLEKSGYSYWYIFDNWGNFLSKESASGNLVKIMQHIFDQKNGNLPKTLYYIDVLACTSEDEEICDSIIASY